MSKLNVETYKLSWNDKNHIQTGFSALCLTRNDVAQWYGMLKKWYYVYQAINPVEPSMHGIKKGVFDSFFLLLSANKIYIKK